MIGIYPHGNRAFKGSLCYNSDLWQLLKTFEVCFSWLPWWEGKEQKAGEAEYVDFELWAGGILTSFYSEGNLKGAHDDKPESL